MRSSLAIVKMIGEVRANNNLLWMRLLELALLHAPADAKAALRAINENDKAISALLRELTK